MRNEGFWKEECFRANKCFEQWNLFNQLQFAKKGKCWTLLNRDSPMLRLRGPRKCRGSPAHLRASHPHLRWPRRRQMQRSRRSRGSGRGARKRGRRRTTRTRRGVRRGGRRRRSRSMMQRKRTTRKRRGTGFASPTNHKTSHFVLLCKHINQMIVRVSCCGLCEPGAGPDGGDGGQGGGGRGGVRGRAHRVRPPTLRIRLQAE